ncbi:uncharacterized protein LOC132387603 isoform X3 [Hypanus sabinus]|nr:uncharacterized protein LOC132387603 isoform X3 [Hypanus sabinus]
MVVPQGCCCGKKSGWLNGPHPNVGEGEVTRTVCFSKDENPCEKNQKIRVKNCSGYFVYRLEPTTGNDSVYCTVTDSALGDPCVNHTVLDQPRRSTDCNCTKCTGGEWKGDKNLAVGWYRFNSSGGSKIPEMVVPQGCCCGKKSGWLKGPHPNVGEGEVTRTVCFSKDENPCEKNQKIRVKNCSGYFVYRLEPTTGNDSVYCTVTDSALGDPCVNHTVLDQPWRSTDCNCTKCTGGEWKGDKNLAVGWYRFNSSGGSKIPEMVVPQGCCCGKKSSWLKGPHPNVGEGEVTRAVCFSKDENPCEKNQEIRVKNCSGYFVYRLEPPTGNDSVYCTVTDSALGDPCVTHTVLDQPWRSTNCSNTECTDGQWMGDGNLAVGWYRFNSSGGWKIPETVIPQDHCSGQYPGWLNGPHPNVGEGEVTRTVCFTVSENTCYWSREIRVKNCSGYLVYRLGPTTGSNAVYCTDSALGDPCVTHTVLDQPWRSMNCSNTECTGGQWRNDVNLAVGWYRFNSSGGWKIPETVVPQGRCSGEFPGWLNGPHPNVGEGEVTRTACFTQGEDSCYRSQEIGVKNCSGYFVYRLLPAPLSYAVYCTDLEASTMDQSNGSSTGQPIPSPSSVSEGQRSSDSQSDTTQEPQGSATGGPGPGLSTTPAGSASSDPDRRTSPNAGQEKPTDTTCKTYEMIPVNELLLDEECEGMISSVKVLYLGQKNLGDPQEREAYLDQIREILRKQLPCKQILSRRNHDKGNN